MTILRRLVFVLVLAAMPFTVLAAKVNINTADPAALAQLEGVGAAKAEAIVQYRESHGAFATVEDLVKVDGIGEKTLSANRDQITVE